MYQDELSKEDREVVEAVRESYSNYGEFDGYSHGRPILVNATTIPGWIVVTYADHDGDPDSDLITWEEARSWHTRALAYIEECAEDPNCEGFYEDNDRPSLREAMQETQKNFLS